MNNQVVLVGKIKNEPKSSKLKDGTFEITFDLETENEYENADGKKDKNIISCRYKNNKSTNLKQGNVIGIKGNLNTSKKQIGSINMDDLEVVPYQINFLANQSENIPSLNHAIITGRLVSNPELKETSTGRKVVNITLAIQNESKEKNTIFVKSTLWGNLANNISKYSQKGDIVGIRGTLKTSDKTVDNDKNFVLELVGESVTFIPNTKNKNVEENKNIEKGV